jgi:hypothetical protein
MGAGQSATFAQESWDKILSKEASKLLAADFKQPTTKAEALNLIAWMSHHCPGISAAALGAFSSLRIRLQPLVPAGSYGFPLFSAEFTASLLKSLNGLASTKAEFKQQLEVGSCQLSYASSTVWLCLAV